MIKIIKIIILEFFKQFSQVKKFKIPYIKKYNIRLIEYKN